MPPAASASRAGRAHRSSSSRATNAAASEGRRPGRPSFYAPPMRLLLVLGAVFVAAPAAAAPPVGDAVVRDAAGHVHVVTPPVARGEHRLDTRPTLSPDESRVAFVRYAPSHRGVFVVGADGRGLRALRLLETTERVDSLAWSPDGTAVLVAINGFKPGWVERIGVDSRERLKVWTFPADRWGTVAAYGWSADGAAMRFAATYGGVGPSLLLAGDGAGSPTVLERADGLPPSRWAEPD